MHNSIRRLTEDSGECAQFRTVRAGNQPFLFISRTRLIGLPCGYYGTIIAENTSKLPRLLQAVITDGKHPASPMISKAYPQRRDEMYLVNAKSNP